MLADDAHAEAEFQAALRADLIRWPWLRARLELAYGSWLRRQRRVADSRLPLRSALTTFDLIGAGSWARQARAELRAAGERGAADEPPPGRTCTGSSPSSASRPGLSWARGSARRPSHRLSQMTEAPGRPRRTAWVQDTEPRAIGGQRP